VSARVYFVSASQVSLPLSVTVSKVVTERTVPLLLIGKQNNDHHDALVPLEKEKELGIFDEVCFL
jgi:hypothetical protein